MQAMQKWYQDLSHRLPFRQLRNRLLLFASIVLIPMIIFGSLAIRQDVSHTKRQILNSSFAIARILETNLTDMITTTERLLFTLGKSPTIRSQDARYTRQLFIDVFPIHPTLLNLAASRHDGSIFASVVWGGLDPPTVNNDPLFHETLESEQLVISGRMISKATDQRAVRLFLPYKDDKGEIIGTLLAEISLSQLQRSLSSISIEEGATFIVTDSEGMVLIHPDYTYVYEGTDISSLPSVQAALKGEQGTLEHDNPADGKRWLWAYTPVQDTGWAVVVGYPTEIAYPSVYESLLRGTIFLLAMIGVAGMLAFVLSKRLANPIRELTQSAQAISAGDLSQKVNVQGSGELRQLAYTFNVMSENLKRHMEELAAAKEEISQKAKHLQLLLAHTISLQEEERRRIAGELHDGISQLLLGALYETEAAKEALDRDPLQAIEDLDRAQSLLEQTSTEMRRVIYDLRPPLLDDIGFIPALDQYVKNFSERTGINVSLDITGKIRRFPQDSELALYRISQEALHNIHRHAHTDQANIHIHFFDHQMQMTIRDQGIGFNPSDLDLFRLKKWAFRGLKNALKV